MIYVLVDENGQIINQFDDYNQAQYAASQIPYSRLLTAPAYQRLMQRGNYEHRVTVNRPKPTIKRSIIPNMIGTYHPYRKHSFKPPTNKKTLSEENDDGYY